MSLLIAHQLSKSYGVRDIFLDLSFSIPRGARVALVGPNGIGKTTLLRILAGEDVPTSGRLNLARSTRIGYLSQERGTWDDTQTNMDHTLWEEALNAFEPLLAMESELARLEQELATNVQDHATLMEAYGKLQLNFERHGGYTYPTRIRMVLTGLGFVEDNYQQPLRQLSSGQRTRAVLARLLLSSPDLLILDEPTNHLDIQAVEWLESYLNQMSTNGEEMAALIVSHDRYFLDQVCNAVWEMGRTIIETYRGNYSAYLQQREQRWELRHQRFEAEKERLVNEMDYIRRNIAGQNISQAKGKLKRISRQVEAIEQLGFEAVLNQSWSKLSPQVNISMSTMGVDEADRRIRALRDPILDSRPPQFHMNLHSRLRSGELVLRSRELVVGYPGRMLFQPPNLELRRLECAALIGPNGSGKTTFLKTVLGQLEPLGGEVLLGSSLRIGYFAQAHEELNPENTLMQEIDSVEPSWLPEQVRSYLGRFLFRGDDVFKQVKLLSGGERGRLALSKLALINANLLLLDEPTNHLDIPAQEVLQSVLEEFQGTILLVSHDRYLINRLATQIWEIDSQTGHLKVFLGTYSEYRQSQEQRPVLPARAEASSNSAPAQLMRAQKVEKNRSKSEKRKRAVRLAELEELIDTLESEVKSLSAQLENPPDDYGEVQRLGELYMLRQQELTERLAEWDDLAEPIPEDEG